MTDTLIKILSEKEYVEFFETHLTHSNHITKDDQFVHTICHTQLVKAKQFFPKQNVYLLFLN